MNDRMDYEINNPVYQEEEKEVYEPEYDPEYEMEKEPID